MSLIKLYKTLSSGALKGHFGQWSEDVLIRKLFDRKKKDGVYLDIGAYHPFKHSNTAYFWIKGWKGYNIDANPKTITLFKNNRPSDVNIWAAIVPNNKQAADTVNLMLADKSDLPSGVSATGTCNPAIAADRQFKSTIKVPAKTISQIINENHITKIDYLNIDVEGYDAALISDFDFSTLRPKVISVEDYGDSLNEVIESSITKKLTSDNYILVARAGPTSIFLSNS